VRHRELRSQALNALQQHRIDGLVASGGNDSQAGAEALSRMGFPVVGIASTIDNDLCGSEITIGVDTALNIALEAIDRLKAGEARLGREADSAGGRAPGPRPTTGRSSWK
jgi:6-phosphofructokinase